MRSKTRIITLKTYKWKVEYRKRVRCYMCEKRNRIVYRCSRCKKGVCVIHSSLICKRCRTCPKHCKVKWKVTNAYRMRCCPCNSPNKVPYRCNVCGFGTCPSHANLLCQTCNGDCRLFQKL